MSSAKEACCPSRPPTPPAPPGAEAAEARVPEKGRREKWQMKTIGPIEENE